MSARQFEPTSVRVPKAGELIAEELRRRIVTGELRAGDALPMEAELMAQFGVSRPTLREAVRILESESLIAVHRGTRGGARIQVPSEAAASRQAALLLRFRGATMSDVFEARATIEPAAARILAGKRTRKDLRRLEDNLSEVERLQANESAAPEDVSAATRSFHKLIVELAGNQTLVLMHNIIFLIINQRGAEYIETEQGRQNASRDLKRTQRTHRALYELIMEGDAAGAFELWHRHLVESERYLVPNGAGAIPV